MVEQSKMIMAINYQLRYIYSLSLSFKQLKDLPAEGSVELTLLGMVGHQLHVQTLFPNYLDSFET
jgi:hypothetical protein